ncbi:MAG: hypothetical protein IJR88_05335 [Clostridia bacterium]|nr:hypothetical protein [Clostridia bacterium]
MWEELFAKSSSRFFDERIRGNPFFEKKWFPHPPKKLEQNIFAFAITPTNDTQPFGLPTFCFFSST